MILADYVVAQASVLIVPSLKKFQTQLQKELQKQQRLAGDLTIDVQANTKKFVAEAQAAKQLLEKDPVNIRFRVLDATKQITEIRHRYEDLQREMKKGLILNLKVVGLSVLPQLVQGLAAVNASMVQLTQSALALPGIFSGVLSSVGALSVGLGGIKDAFKEYGEAQKNAAQEGLKARNAALNVQNAYRDLGRSIKDAKRNLEDLNAQLRDAPLDEAEAIIRVAEAQQEAANKFEKSGLQQQKDILALQRAENELVQVRLRNSRLIEDAATANAKGVAGADSVREATDRLAKAQDDAATKATKLSDSLKQLSPNAQKFVETVTGMSDQWAAFKNAVQDRLFDGLGAEVAQLAQTTLPLLQKGFSGIATEINGNLKTAMQVLQTESNRGFLDKIFSDTAKAQANLSGAFDPLIDSFLRLSAVGTSFLPRMVDGLNDLLTRFDNFVVRAEADGSLEKWTNQGIDELKALGNSIINLGSILNSVSEAFTGSGGRTFLEVLESGTEKLAEFLRSAEGQTKLTDFFREARLEFDKWQPLLSAIPGLLSNLADAGQAWADALLPFLSAAGRLLADHPGLVNAVFAAFIAWKGVLPILKGMNSGFQAINGGIQLFQQTLRSTNGGPLGGFAQKVGLAQSALDRLSNAIFSPAGVIAGVTLAATWIGTNLAKAHSDAAAAAQRQKDDLDALKQSLDDVTGSATNASRAMVSENIREGLNEATGQRFGDVFAGVSADQANAAIGRIVEGDRSGAIAAVGGGLTSQEVEQTPFWNDFGPSLRDAGLSSEVVAQAVNGDPDGLAKFNQWFDKLNRDGVRIPGTNIALPEGLRRGLNYAGIVDSPNASLKDLQDQLSPDQQLRAARAGEINSAVSGLQTGSADIRTDNERAFGRYRLKPGSPFESLGVIGEPGVGQDGGGLVTRSAPADGSALADQLRNSGVTFRADGDRFIVRISPESIDKYFEKYASGGLISGPGSGRSDSILARLSNGEFVVNARSTQKHLPLLEQINGGGMPGFAEGGLLGDAFKPTFPVAPPKPVSPQSFMETRSPSNIIGSAAGALPQEQKLASELPNSGTDWSRKPSPPPSGWGLPVVGLSGSSISRAAGAANFFPATLFGRDVPGYGQTSAGTASSDSMFYGDRFNDLRNLSNPFTDVRQSPGTFLDALISDVGLGKPTSALARPWSVGASMPASAPKAPAPAAPKPAPKAPAPSKPVVPAPTSTTTGGAPVVHGSGSSPGPGNEIPHLTPGKSAGVGPSVSAISEGTGMPPSVVTQAVPPAVLQTPIVGPALAQAAFEQLPAYGLPAQTDIKYGAGGFPDWVYQLGEEFGMAASTYPNHQTGSGFNRGIDWAPKEFAWNTPQGADLMTRFAKYLASTGMIEQVIYQNPFTGETVGVLNGKLVGPGTDNPGYYRDDWGGHQDHIHIRTSRQIPTSSQLAALGLSSPSNMPMAMTPTGVPLPQMSYAPGVSGSAPMGPLSGSGSGSGGQDRPPTPEEMTANYMEYVADAWQNILMNLGQNIGNIALNFVGGLTGLNFGPLTNLGNNAISGIGGGLDAVMRTRDGEGGDVASTMGAIPQVDAITQAREQLPSDYQEIYDRASANSSPEQSLKVLQYLLGLSQGGSASTQYDPSKGAEQWRPLVRQILSQRAKLYGITNVQAWEDALVKQIQTESNGNPFVDNLNDTDGKGGTQQVFGLGQFLPSTFAAHNVLGGDIRDPASVIAAMIDYVAKKYGMDSSGGPNQIGRGVGYASGGRIKGRGSGMSDSIIARVSNGEFLVRAPMAQKHLGLLQAINSNKLPGFADGMMWPVNQPAPVTPPPVTTPPPPPAPVPPPPGGPAADAAAGQPTAPAPVANNMGAGDEESTALQEIGSALGGIGSALGGVEGAEAPAGGTPEGDQRSVLGAAPQNLDHNKPAVSMGIQGAAGAIAGAVSTAISAAAAGASMGAGGGAAGGAASAPISSLIQAGGTAVTGAVNILSSLAVGTLTRGNSTAGAYGTPLTPQGMGQQPYSGPAVVNNWNGGVHTQNNEEFYKLQQRRELQNASPYLPQR